MPAALEELIKPTLYGRSSSHFTRITRIFAAELGIEYTLHVSRELMSENPADYGGNPALKLPAFINSRGAWFGALNICRELWRMAGEPPQIIWPEDLKQPLLANAMELGQQAMATEVSLVMSKLAAPGDDNAHQIKMRKSLTDSVAWLENNVNRVLDALPVHRRLSYLETTIFCLIAHLEFRNVLPVAPYVELNKFRQAFAARPSVAETVFRFDV